MLALNLKKTAYKIFLNFVIFGFIVSLFPSIKLPSDFLYWFGVMMIVSITVMLYENLLMFLTVKKNYLTSLVSISLIAALFLYILSLFAPGFEVNQMSVETANISFITIEPFSLNEIGIIIICSLLVGLFVPFFNYLNKSE